MVTKSCDFCSAVFRPRALTSRFCSPKCRQAAYRQRQRPEYVPDVADSMPHPTVDAVKRDLQAAGRLNTYRGACALAFAERIDASTAVMGFAALVKELRSTMAVALEGAHVLDVVDEVRARRDRKMRTGAKTFGDALGPAPAI